MYHDDYTNPNVEPYWTKPPKLCTKCKAPWLQLGDVMFCRYCENTLVVNDG